MGNYEERVQRQLDVDQEIKTLGDQKHDKNSLRLAQDGGFGETEAGKRFTNQAIKGFVEKFNSYVDKQLLQPATSSALVKRLTFKGEGDIVEYKLDPSTIGKIVVRSLLRSLVKPEDKRITITGVSFDIGEAVEQTIREVQLDEHHAKDKRKLMDMLRRQEKLDQKDEIAKLLSKLSERVNVDHEVWEKPVRGNIGEVLIRLFYKSKVYIPGVETDLVFGDLFVEHEEQVFHKGSKKTRKTIDISDVGTLWLDQNNEYIKDITLSFLPMVTEPQDWTIDHGGYRDQAIYDTYSLIKGYTRDKIKKLYEKYPQGFNKLIETINILQHTPFRINNTVWNAVEWVHLNELDLDRKGIPNYVGGWYKMIGEDKSNEFFGLKRMLVRDPETKRLTPDSKKLLLDFMGSVIEGANLMNEKDLWKEWSNLRKSVIKHSRSETSKRILVENTLNDSGKFLDEDIYFCYNADYRGRIYPLAGQFSPQGSDISRGMLEFANGVTVDPMKDHDATRQIRIVVANNWGEDKVSLDDREMWTAFNTDWITNCALDYQKNKEWMKADKPFLFLRSAMELLKICQATENGTTFESTLPIAFDGSCNGIQHYSALFLDPKGAEAVNLVKSEVPSDVYQNVADMALEIAKVSKGKYEGLVVELNDALDGKLFGRKVAKRSVMTLPYGVSKRSSNAYVYEEVDALLRSVSLSGAERKGVRGKMGNLIWEAILLVVEKPVTGKEYFQKVAQEMAGWEKGLLWFTPTGFPVTQNLKKRDVKPNLLVVTITDENEEGEKTQEVFRRKYPRYTSEIDGGEQANAVAPNYVHSFDTAHLQFSITAAAKEGMENFLVIHDSFSTDCMKASRFNHVIREQFVKMYSGKNYINKFHNDCEEQLGVPLTTTMEERGDFDMLEVLESEYFFS